MPGLPHRRPFRVGQPFKPMDGNLFHIGSFPYLYRQGRHLAQAQ
jgi:hypothetical protein